MRVDVVTIFPDYLAPLELSLVGKARRDGLLDLRVHDLRDVTTDRHRTVDDTPFGGGAGMVMRPDVWGAALDDVIGGGPAVLLVPTPSGARLTQAMAQELAGAERIVIACGRYEGIDARVAEHYAAVPGVQVREVSIGDYVLNGGEVAALVVVEAVARLLPGVVGNPASLVEESHGEAGLLEYPVYTKPPVWAGLAVPEVLTSGHHGRVARWRRDQALARTAERRPDMLAALAPEDLDAADRKLLAGLGWYVPAGSGPVRVRVRDAVAADAPALADLAAATFPLACPPALGSEDIAAFVESHLTAAHFAAYLAEPERYLVQVAETAVVDAGGVAGGGKLVGYTLVVLPLSADEVPAAPEVADAVPGRPAAELSKCYVLPELHGTGVGGALMRSAADAVADRRVDGEPVATLWLGTNKGNRRAQRSYLRHGYTTVGTRTFRVGGALEEDVVMARPVPHATPEPDVGG